MARKTGRAAARTRQVRTKTPVRVLLGVTGGIAAYKALELLRLCRKAGWEVQVAMTRHAARLVAPESFAALSSRPVACELFPAERPPEQPAADRSRIGHVDLASWADLVVVAPATANIIGKLATGVADDLLSTLLLAVPQEKFKAGRVILVPAMNTNMWLHPAVQQNVRSLLGWGCTILGPEPGELACGAWGVGRLLEPETVFHFCQTALADRLVVPDLAGRRVLVTAGRTEEKLDPVRVVTNRSSGRTGVAIARAFAATRAQVTLVAGPVSVPLPSGVELVRVNTTAEMLQEVSARVTEADLLVMCAAVADYRPARPGRNKEHAGSLSLALKRTPDILSSVNKVSHSARVIGFSLDSSLAAARAKLKTKRLDLVVANSFDTPGATTIRPVLIGRTGTPRRLPEMTKERFGIRLAAEAARLLGRVPNNG